MKKTTLKNIKNTEAIDITNYSFEAAKELGEKELGLDVLALSHGTYGMNGALLKGFATGTIYKITARTSTLFQLV